MSEGGFLGQRRLNLSELESPVRRVIFTTYAVLLGLAAAVVVREQLHGPEVLTEGGYFVPWTIVYISAVPGGMALAMLLAGAAHARTRWRYLLIGPILLAVASSILAAPVDHQGGATAALEVALHAPPVVFFLACMAVVAAGARFRTRATLYVCLGLVTAFVASVAAFSYFAWAPYDPTALIIVMISAIAFLQPALLVVGFDIAEIGSEAAATALRRVEDAPRRARVAGWSLLVAGFGVAVVLHLGMGYNSGPGAAVLALWIALLAIALCLAAVLIARRPEGAATPRAELGYLQVLVVAIIIALSSFAGVTIQDPNPEFFNYGGPHRFAVRLPDGLKEISRSPAPSSRDPYAATVVRFLTGKVPPSLAIVGLLRPEFAPGEQQPTDVNTLIGVGVSTLPRMPLNVGAPDAHGWRRGEVGAGNAKGHQFRFFILKHEVPTHDRATDMDWYLVCGGGAEQADKVKSMCEEARRTFHSVLEEQSSRALAVAFSGLFLAAALAMVLASHRARREETPVLDFAAWGLFLTGARWIGGYAFGGVNDPLDDLRFAADLLSAMLAVAAVAAVSLEAWPTARGHNFDLYGARRLASQAVAGLVVIAGLFFLYVFAAGHSEHSQAIRGAIICLALTWELATAGPSLNPSSEHHAFPRSSRVLIFVGYLILVATCVFLFSNSRMYDGRVVGAWDTESIVAGGLVILGGALTISRTLRGLPGLRLVPAPPP